MVQSQVNDFDIVIKPGNTEKNYWRDLWRFRELFYILTWRDIKVRYKQTVLGVGWSVLRPLLSTIILTVVFGKIANIKSEVPNELYPILVFAGMLPWTFFSGALSETSNSLVSNSNLISKIYFPRLIVPASTVIVALVDFLISFGILIIMFVYYQFVPNWRIIFLPVFLLMAFIAAFGVGLFLTALNVKYRDFRFVMPFIVQFGMYVSPVGFSSKALPDKLEQFKSFYALNPMVGVIDGFRWCIFGEVSALDPKNFSISLAVTLFSLWFGIWYFRKTEKTFADII